MPRTLAPRPAILAGTLASLMVAGALPASAVNIPEGGAVTPDSVFLFHFRVIEGCEGLPTDELEVTIPEGVTNPKPEAVAGWDVEIEDPAAMDEEMDEVETEESEEAEASDDAAEDGDEDEFEPIVVRWAGGELEDGLLLDFGMRARFPDTQDEVLEFEVVQRCGEIEQEFTPTVKLTTRYGQGEISALADSVDVLRAEVDVLRADVDKIQSQVGEVNVTGLRNRVVVLEDEVVELDERVTAIEEQPVSTPLPEE
jgi:uncharacterized protein YcnI